MILAKKRQEDTNRRSEKAWEQESFRIREKLRFEQKKRESEKKQRVKW